MIEAAPFTAPLRIVRQTERQGRLRPYVEAGADDLLRGARGEGREVELPRLHALADSLWHSPYSRDRLREAHLSPRDLRTFEDLAAFPTLDRATLAKHWSELPSLTPGSERDEGLVIVQSSGTTGVPARVVRSERECVHMWAALRFWARLLRVEVPQRPRVALLDSLPSGLEYSVRLPVLERGALHRISLVKPRPFERLARVRPSVLFSDPAGLHALLAQSEIAPLKLILTSAQHFAPSLRARLAERCPAPVVNYYATTETGPLAWECLAHLGVFHTMHPDVWIESLDGALAVTRLRPSPLPLLRYLPGDTGSVDDGTCSCGFVGRSIRNLDGRSHCAFIAPDGRWHDAWSLAWLFKLEPLASFELSQAGVERFVLTTASRSDAALHLVPRLEEALRRLGWSAPRVEARFEQAIPPRAKATPFTRSYGAGSSSAQPSC